MASFLLLATELPHDPTSPPHDRGHAGPQSPIAHPIFVSLRGDPVRASFGKSPHLLGQHLSAKSVTVVLAALRFLDKVILKRQWNDDDIATHRTLSKLPVVLSQQEVGQFLAAVRNLKPRTILTTCYTAGLRVSEAIPLKPEAIDSQRMTIRVEQAKDASTAMSCSRHGCWNCCGTIDAKPIRSCGCSRDRNSIGRCRLSPLTGPADRRASDLA